MELLKEYILSVVSAALLVGITREILGKKSGMGAFIYLISGLLLMAVVIKPIATLDLSELAYHLPLAEVSAEDLILDGQQQFTEGQNAIIKQTVEAYILDKAKEYSAEITVEVTLSNGDVPVPWDVTVRGTVSPYTKMQLIHYIEDELGIPEVNQKWTGPH